MIRNIIFDIGQVLVDFRWRNRVKEIASTEEIKTRMENATVLSPYWNEMDRGLKSEEELIDKCVESDPGIEKEIREFFSDPLKLIIEYPYAAPMLRNLKEQGYHVYLLSNYGRTNFETGKKRFEFIKNVDGMVISYEIYHVKPEKEMYETILSKYDLVADECLFIDDKKVNIEVGMEFGIHGMVFTTFDEAKRNLLDYGIKLN